MSTQIKDDKLKKLMLNFFDGVLPERLYTLDIEANSLDPDVIWCVVLRDFYTKEEHKFYHEKSHEFWSESFRSFIDDDCYFIGHNLIGYDVPVMNKLLKTNISLRQIVDTLVVSRLCRPVSPFKNEFGALKKRGEDTRAGGHSLDAWGKRLGYAKIDFNDFSKYTDEMLTYCVGDVRLTERVFMKLLTEFTGFSYYSMRLEHKVAEMLNVQEKNGFFLDQTATRQMQYETNELLEEMNEQLQTLFPPKEIFQRNLEIRTTKSGDFNKVDLKTLDRYQNSDNCSAKELKDGTYDLYIIEEFNPQSSKQIGERLLDVGWEPKVFTPTGSPKTSKDVLGDAIDELIIRYPHLEQLTALSNYNIIADRLQKASKWLSLVEEDNRVHGQINPIGAGTHRCSHYNDNMANIASVQTKKKPKSSFDAIDFSKLEEFDRFDNNKILLHHDDEDVEYALSGLEGAFGWDSRNCWTASSKEHCIVGADASGIQLRGLAHYMNDPSYTKELLEGDIHTANGRAAGILDLNGNVLRPKAKTFIYAWLLGAGDEKVGLIVGVVPEEYKELFAWAKNYSMNNFYDRGDPSKQTLIHYVMGGLRHKGRKADEITVATIIKGFKVKKQFLERTPSLKRLKEEEIPAVADQGYLIGLDGRKLHVPSEHLAMSLYLQGYEAVIMKLAMYLYQKTLKEKDIPFMQVAFVHDEFQIETRWEHAPIVGQAVVDGIIEAGKQLESRCPLDGEYKIGSSWAKTH